MTPHLISPLKSIPLPNLSPEGRGNKKDLLEQAEGVDRILELGEPGEMVAGDSASQGAIYVR